MRKFEEEFEGGLTFGALKRFVEAGEQASVPPGAEVDTRRERGGPVVALKASWEPTSAPQRADGGDAS